jgi:hypothetical protein
LPVMLSTEIFLPLIFALQARAALSATKYWRFRERANTNRSVHDQVSRSGWATGGDPWLSCPYDYFAEFFAELCASEAPIVPLGSSVLR